MTPGRRSVELAPASGERVRDMLDTELRSIGPPRDPDDVEAHRAAEVSAPRQVERRGPGHVLPLLEVHSEKGRRRIVAGAKLHFDEDDRAAVERDQIDLAAALPHISIDHFKPAQQAERFRDPLTAPRRPLPPLPRATPPHP